jgi:hypothetical protein
MNASEWTRTVTARREARRLYVAIASPAVALARGRRARQAAGSHSPAALAVLTARAMTARGLRIGRAAFRVAESLSARLYGIMCGSARERRLDRRPACEPVVLVAGAAFSSIISSNGYSSSARGFGFEPASNAGFLTM